jgi:hypothetical protein
VFEVPPLDAAPAPPAPGAPPIVFEVPPPDATPAPPLAVAEPPALLAAMPSFERAQPGSVPTLSAYSNTVIWRNECIAVYLSAILLNRVLGGVAGYLKCGRK